MKSLSSDATGRFNQFFNDLRDGLLVLFVAHVRRLAPAAGPRIVEAGWDWRASQRLLVRRFAVKTLKGRTNNAT
jgi:hypothetical protein